MKAIAVRPGTPGSVHLGELPEPMLAEVPDEQGVLARVLAVGVDATDREHESLCRVDCVGARVKNLSPGDHVVFMVRRPGTSLGDHLLERVR